MDTLDQHTRPLRSLRLSVTDRCNLRCSYCMPEESYTWLERPSLATFEELIRFVDAFVDCGVRKVRLTGGEPLLRRDLDVLVRLLLERDGVDEVALTTNGVLLVDQAAALKASGLSRLTVSLDTLRRDRFEKLTRRNDLGRVLKGIEAQRAAGFEDTKLDCVVVRGHNEDELEDLLEFGGEDIEVRFIEYMDVGGATNWRAHDVVSRREMLDGLERRYGKIEVVAGRGSAPAVRYRLPDGRVFGIIASTTVPFCSNCDRSRITADGRVFLCLYAKTGHDLLSPLRAGESQAALVERVRSLWQGRADRGAEERFADAERGRSHSPEDLRDNPHLEMHTRGG